MKARPSGIEAVAFLKSCEGASADFSQEGTQWSLWLPELPARDRPITPATQLCFPVILRSGEQAFAMRCYYDCSTGKMRYYTGAIPTEIARTKEFESAVCAMFDNRLEIEPIKHRQLRTGRNENSGTDRTQPSIAETRNWAEPERNVVPSPAKPAATAEPVRHIAVEAPIPNPVLSTAIEVKPREVVSAKPVPHEPLKTPADPRSNQVVRVELCDHTRSVLLILIAVVAILGLAGIGAWVYIQRNVDTGVLHHRMQLEELKLRSGGR